MEVSQILMDDDMEISLWVEAAALVVDIARCWCRS